MSAHLLCGTAYSVKELHCGTEQWCPRSGAFSRGRRFALISVRGQGQMEVGGAFEAVVSGKCLSGRWIGLLSDLLNDSSSKGLRFDFGLVSRMFSLIIIGR